MQILQWNFNNTMIRTRYYLLFWMNFVADLLWLFRSFYLRHSSVERQCTWLCTEKRHHFFTAPRILIFTIYSHFRTEIFISKHYYCVYWVTYIHLHTKVRPENTNISKNYQWHSGHFPALEHFPASMYIYSHSCPIDTL